MSKRHLLALFSNFDEAEAVVKELRKLGIKGFNADKDMIVKSPIEHPEVEQFLGDKPVSVQWFTLVGALLGGSLAFLFISASQGNFFAQLKGGKPIVPFPPDFVLTYEMFILGGVYISVLGFLIAAHLSAILRRNPYRFVRRTLDGRRPTATVWLLIWVFASEEQRPRTFLT